MNHPEASAPPTWREIASDVKRSLGALKRWPVPEEELADFIGHVDALRAVCADIVKTSRAEAPDELVGTEYALEEDGSNKYTFNTIGLVMQAGVELEDDPGEVAMSLIAAGVFKVKNITALETWARQSGVSISVSRKDVIEDPGGQLVGKRWQKKPQKIVGVTSPKGEAL